MARRRRPKIPKPPKPKSVSYELIDRASDIGRALYAIMDDLIERFHEELTGARVVLAWCTSWKPDADGNVTLGKCKKASDLDRELATHDFVILLRRAFFESTEVTPEQRRALIDHELTHATVKVDKNGEPVEDIRGRKIYRMRKHDVEEFSSIVDRHGLWKRDLERLAAAIERNRQLSLLEERNTSSAEKIAAGNPAFRLAPPKNGNGESRITTADAARALTTVAAAVEAVAEAVEFDEAEPPSTCGKCGRGVRQVFAGFMCESSTATEGAAACDWIARPRGKTIDGTPIEQPSPDDAEDVLPRCKVCHQAPLSADDVERGDGMHQACIPVPAEVRA